MKTFNVKLTSISEVKRFVALANDQDFEIDLVSGRYVIDAKSIMGIFSLDLAQPIRVEVHGGDAQSEAFKQLVSDFVI